MKRVRYYTDTGLYMGSGKLSRDNFLEYISWARSGNYLKYGDEVVGSRAGIETLFKREGVK